MFRTCLINSVSPVDLAHIRTLYFAALFPEMKKEEDKDLPMLTRI